MFWLQRGHFSACFGSQERSLSCFNQARGQFSVFCQPRGHFGMLFGSQEDTLVHVLAPRGHFSPRFSTIGPQGGQLPPPPLCTSLGGIVRVSNVTTHQQEGCFAFCFPILIILYSFINNWPNAVDVMLFRSHVGSCNRQDSVCG